MSAIRYLIIITLVMCSFQLTGCQSSKRHIIGSDESQVELRSIQSRNTYISDRERIMRVVMATLQDLGFVIDSADFDIGTITATKLDRYALRMTVTVRERRRGGSRIRANAQYQDSAVEDPEPYQEFFNSLSKAEFLELHLLEPQTDGSNPAQG